MANDSNHFESVCLEVMRHLEDTETSKLGHWYAAEVYEKYNKYLIGIPATLFSIILTWLVSSQAKSSVGNELVLGISSLHLQVVLSLVVSILSGLSAFLNLNELAARHRTAAENLNALSRDCRNWNTDFPDSSLCIDAVKCVQSYRQRLNEINRDAPQIPKWAWENTKKQKSEGSVSYNFEMKV